MERKQKIQLLYDISKGIVKAESLQPQDQLLKMVLGDNIKYILNYFPCSKEEYDAAKAKGKCYDVTLNLDPVRSGVPCFTSESQLKDYLVSRGEWIE